MCNETKRVTVLFMHDYDLPNVSRDTGPVRDWLFVTPGRKWSSVEFLHEAFVNERVPKD